MLFGFGKRMVLLPVWGQISLLFLPRRCCISKVELVCCSSVVHSLLFWGSCLMNPKEGRFCCLSIDLFPWFLMWRSHIWEESYFCCSSETKFPCFYMSRRDVSVLCCSSKNVMYFLALHRRIKKMGTGRPEGAFVAHLLWEFLALEKPWLNFVAGDDLPSSSTVIYDGDDGGCGGPSTWIPILHATKTGLRSMRWATKQFEFENLYCELWHGSRTPRDVSTIRFGVCFESRPVDRKVCSIHWSFKAKSRNIFSTASAPIFCCISNGVFLIFYLISHSVAYLMMLPWFYFLYWWWWWCYIEQHIWTTKSRFRNEISNKTNEFKDRHWKCCVDILIFF